MNDLVCTAVRIASPQRELLREPPLGAGRPRSLFRFLFRFRTRVTVVVRVNRRRALLSARALLRRGRRATPFRPRACGAAVDLAGKLPRQRSVAELAAVFGLLRLLRRWRARGRLIVVLFVGDLVHVVRLLLALARLRRRLLRDRLGALPAAHLLEDARNDGVDLILVVPQELGCQRRDELEQLAPDALRADSRQIRAGCGEDFADRGAQGPKVKRHWWLGGVVYVQNNLK